MHHLRTRLTPLIVTCLLCTALAPARADDGYRLWLAPAPLAAGSGAAARPAGIVAPAASSAVAENAVNELAAGLARLLGAAPPSLEAAERGAIVLGTPANSALVAGLGLPLREAGPEGYLIRGADVGGQPVTVLAANSDVGLLYGVFALLRELGTGGTLDGIDLVEAPAVDLRVLNHWDNLDRSVERGYAGQSIWDWWRLPAYRDPRYRDYGRANASIGINGTVLNNVNASATSLTPRYIAKAAALADELRPWGMRVYLSARFSAPLEVGGLDTADPLDPAVRAWWSEKAAEIYAAIPDFGGFLVKANSEGQPGPQDYGRTHADGANMLAAAVAPHGGVVMWRAFVYAAENPEDRARQAHSEFAPLDGEFAANVIVQVKNGPIDFQPREPFHPLFGGMRATPVMMEFQITKEYLGFATHLVYLGPLFEEVLDADTLVRGPGSTVARIMDGSVFGWPRTAIAGVANIGTDRDWSGSVFNQANWYVYGRLAWNPELAADAIAREWLRLTFSRDDDFVEPALEMMMRSHQAAVDYMTPLGLAHLMGTWHHYGPAPWVSELDRPEWNPVYYHRADAGGIGFDRTESGSNAVEQYAPPVAEVYGSLARVPDDFLLWFHRVPWDHRMASGRTLWEELVARYDRGVAEVARMRDTWRGLERHVDKRRYRQTAEFLDIQLAEATWWRDACLAYFAEVSGQAFPEGAAAPEHPLEYYKRLEFPFAPGN